VYLLIKKKGKREGDPLVGMLVFAGSRGAVLLPLIA
jgi:hypothetical protein